MLHVCCCCFVLFFRFCSLVDPGFFGWSIDLSQASVFTLSTWFPRLEGDHKICDFSFSTNMHRFQDLLDRTRTCQSLLCFFFVPLWIDIWLCMQLNTIDLVQFDPLFGIFFN